MKNVLKFILSIQLKRSKFVQQVNGFTLIELLVGLLIAFLVLTPLLGFMVNILSTDQKEQAKANSEQEIQTAVDYIANDLQQAVYIYDYDALTKTSNTVPAKSGIQDQIPPSNIATGCSSTTCQPILVFWKRKFLTGAITLSISTTTNKTDDTFVYSLVGYYLIKDSNATWSNAARIARFEISDGVLAASGTDSTVTAGNCTGYPNDKYIDSSTKSCPDPGFQRFNLNLASATGLTQKMNSWKATASTPYKQQAFVLIDYIDQTSIGSTTITCPTGTLSSGSLMGFYACVDVANTTAQVFLRGNALARLQTSNFDYSSNNQTYFPTANVRVQGHGYLFSK
ncbi:hormogonium polysaccharide secretion pseudopilin HpsC [Nostoc sp.]|uniref:hormogonium polysaccharide secretion pseudopilin HpsC n=1 Tax=Nostoc sp. TaxID=1180 RepID=UPI002FFC31B3